MKLCWVLLFAAGRMRLAGSVEPVYHKKKRVLRKSQCGLMVAYNRGYPDTWEEISNGLSRWVQLDVTRRAEPFEAAIQSYAFSYVDPLDEHRLVKIATKKVFQVLAGDLVLQYDNKASFQELAREAGIEGGIVPRAYTTKEQALRAFSPDDVDVVFIKNPTQTAGRDMQVVAIGDLHKHIVPQGYIIQEGLTRNLALFENSRYLVRAHFIIVRGTLYCHHRGFAQVHNMPFQRSSTSTDVQVSHGNFTVYNLDMRFPIRTPEFLNKTIVDQVWDKGLLDTTSIANGTKWMESITRMGPKVGHMLEPLVRATYDDPLRYAYLGIDLIPLYDGSLKMLEINSFPAFRRFDVMVDVILQLLDMKPYDSDLETRLVELWKLPELNQNEL